MHYHRARYYHPQLRRFLNQDVLLGSILSSASLDRYAYTEGNPISFVDPTGYYEQDVHHDLTFSLAVRVGFTRGEAEKIAGANQGVDTSSVTGPFVSTEARRDYHFTTVERRQQMLNDADKSNDSGKFGQFLHAEQDSYSHQKGLTDRTGEAYGPKTGHLTDGHDPDKTYLRPQLAVRMAEDTYQRLREFYERTHGRKACDDWSNIRPVVEQWVKIPR